LRLCERLALTYQSYALGTARCAHGIPCPLRLHVQSVLKSFGPLPYAKPSAFNLLRNVTCVAAPVAMTALILSPRAVAPCVDFRQRRAPLRCLQSAAPCLPCPQPYRFQDTGPSSQLCTGPPALGGFGECCDSNSQCASNFCIPDRRYCSMPCVCGDGLLGGRGARSPVPCCGAAVSHGPPPVFVRPPVPRCSLSLDVAPSRP
jgi:hypothetical protein